MQKLSFGPRPTSATTTESFEVPRNSRPGVFDDYYTTQLSVVYGQYGDEVNKKRKLRAAPIRAHATRHAAADSAAIDCEANSLSNKRRRSAGDDEGSQFGLYIG